MIVTPEGYIFLKSDNYRAVIAENYADSVSSLLNRYNTLHEWASIQPDKKILTGRGINYAVSLPSKNQSIGLNTVIRRNRHGGFFASLTGELFIGDSRAAVELSNYLKLSKFGIATPEVIGYTLYPSLPGFVKADVVTQLLPEGGDLPEVWSRSDSTSRDEILKAVSKLINHLSSVKAWHQDLNLKNIYICDTVQSLRAYILDIDRVVFTENQDVFSLNLKRFARSLEKWKNRWGLDIDQSAVNFISERKDDASKG